MSQRNRALQMIARAVASLQFVVEDCGLPLDVQVDLQDEIARINRIADRIAKLGE